MERFIVRNAPRRLACRLRGSGAAGRLRRSRSAWSWSSPGRPANTARPAPNRSRWRSATSTMPAASRGCKLVTDTRDSQSQGTVAVDVATSSCRSKQGAGDHRRHHLVGVDPDPDLGHGAGEGGAGLARLLLADAHRARPRGQDQRHLLPHHHLGRAAGHGRGEIRARPGLQEARHHPREQRFRRQHGGRVLEGLQGARRQDRLDHALQREPGQLSGRGRPPRWPASPTGSISSAIPVDGATIARAWISQGGPAKFLLNDGMNSADFIKNVGAKYLERRLRHVLGHQPDALDRVFQRQLQGLLRRHRSGQPGGRPVLRRGRHRRARHRRRPARPSRARSRDAIRKVVDPNGTVDPCRQGGVHEGARADQGRQADPL